MNQPRKPSATGITGSRRATACNLRTTAESSQCTRDYNAFCGQLSGELDGLVASLSQLLEPTSDGRYEHLSEIAGLGSVGLLHLIEQQSPRLVFRLDFPLLTLRQLER